MFMLMLVLPSADLITIASGSHWPTPTRQLKRGFEKGVRTVVLCLCSTWRETLGLIHNDGNISNVGDNKPVRPSQSFSISLRNKQTYNRIMYVEFGEMFL